tara:strand:- start:28296 stop:28433 length:138 start_codon:yes stop_codon:yes gene_type:complete
MIPAALMTSSPRLSEDGHPQIEDGSVHDSSPVLNIMSLLTKDLGT